jgi:2-keto-4-pentenoate hydratase/2-oxohepta-3-ene-1,7-dioic acid hydratase in catechol pathway
MKKVNFLHGSKIHTGVLEDHLVIGQACVERLEIPLSQVQLLPPVLEPGKIICVGMNYPPPACSQEWAPPPYPVLFHKVSSSLIGFGAAIQLPAISEHVLYEGELAIVIGSEARNIHPKRALDAVAGYTIANDVGAADIEGRSSQWASGKMFDTFCPLGPALGNRG